MAEDITDRARRWFGRVELDNAPDQILAFAHELLDMLDVLAPSLLDSQESSIRISDHGWTARNATEFRLVHAADSDAALEVMVAPDNAIVSWLTTHEHVEPEDGSPERPWTSVVVDAIAGVLSGEYEVVDHYRGNRLIKSSLVDVADGQERVIGTTGSISGLLLRFGAKRIERRRVDFGVAPPPRG